MATARRVRWGRGCGGVRRWGAFGSWSGVAVGMARTPGLELCGPCTSDGALGHWGARHTLENGGNGGWRWRGGRRYR